jgi:DNA-binding SARP family transcriptional activator
MMDVRLSGPVEVYASDVPSSVGPPLQRGVLAALAVDAGRLVLTETLINRVWGDAAPAHARNSVYVYVARLRRVLGRGEEGVSRLVHRSRGYLLDVDQDQVDLHRFRRLLDQARDQVYNADEQVGLLRHALRLWRGEPLADVSGEWAARIRQSWHQARLDALVSWAKAEHRVGNAGAVIGPLVELVGEYPLVEPLVAELMWALHAAGRDAYALECYSNARRQLVEQLGVEPGSELQKVHRAILLGRGRTT